MPIMGAPPAAAPVIRNPVAAATPPVRTPLAGQGNPNQVAYSRVASGNGKQPTSPGLGNALSQAGYTPGSAAAGNIYGPQQSALAAQQANNALQQALAGQQAAQQTHYAGQQYNTSIQGLNLDQGDINQQLAGLGADRNYLGANRNIAIGNERNDISYDNRQKSYALGLYNRMMGQYGVQRGTIGDQLNEALGKLAAQRSQAQGQFADASQQLGEQVGAQGAFGSHGALERQGFLQSTLGNTLAGYNQDALAAHTQQQTQLSNLQQQIAQTLNQRQTSVSLADRRRIAAQFGIKQANADYKHGIQGNDTSRNRLGIQSQRLGVSHQQYADALQNAQAAAGLNYGQSLGNSVAQAAQYAPQQQSLWLQQATAAQNIDSTIPASQGGTGPG